MYCIIYIAEYIYSLVISIIYRYRYTKVLDGRPYIDRHVQLKTNIVVIIVEANTLYCSTDKYRHFILE